MKLKALYHTLLACCLIFIGSCTNETTTSAKNEIVFKSIPEKEYQAASPFTKKLIDKIDASITAIHIINKNSTVQSQAVIFVSRNTNGKKVLSSFFNNSLFITPMDSTDDDSTNSESGSSENTNPSFTICAPGTASPFIKAAEAYMAKNKKEDLTVNLSSVGDCIKISFK
jgi:hypothetical protein